MLILHRRRELDQLLEGTDGEPAANQSAFALGSDSQAPTLIVSA
jgi:hypothetical protein